VDAIQPLTTQVRRKWRWCMATRMTYKLVTQQNPGKSAFQTGQQPRSGLSQQNTREEVDTHGRDCCPEINRPTRSATSVARNQWAHSHYGRSWRNDTAPEATAIQSSGTAYTNSGETGAHANLSDASTSGQGKSGQQSGTALGGNPAIVIPNAPGNTTPPAADSTTNLLAPHASSVPISHANASAPQTSPPPSQPSATLSAWQNYDGGAGSIVRSASLSGSVNGAEMHVELRSGALGPLEVHAVMHEGSLGAEIHVQGQEAHTLLAAGLPSLERALGERNLRVDQNFPVAF